MPNMLLGIFFVLCHDICYFCHSEESHHCVISNLQVRNLWDPSLCSGWQVGVFQHNTIPLSFRDAMHNFLSFRGTFSSEESLRCLTSFDMTKNMFDMTDIQKRHTTFDNPIDKMPFNILLKYFVIQHFKQFHNANFVINLLACGFFKNIF